MIEPEFAPLANMSPPKGRRPVPANLTVDELSVDAGYQRNLERHNVALIRAIARDWDWSLCQPLIVARRADDSLWIVDGQHRWHAAKLRGDIRDLPCVVIHYGSVEAEAQGFVALNSQRRALTPYALWRAALAGGDPAAMTLDRHLRTHGLGVASGADYKTWSPGQLNNIGRLRALYAQRPAITVRMIAIIGDTFGDQVMRYGATMVSAVDRVLCELGQVDDALARLLKTSTQEAWIQTYERAALAPGLSRTTAPLTVLRALLDRDAPVAEPAPPQASHAPEVRKRRTFEEQLAAVGAGAGLVSNEPVRRPPPDATLGGVGSGML